MFQKDNELARRYRTRTENAPGTRKTMITAAGILASRKIAFVG